MIKPDPRPQKPVAFHKRYPYLNDCMADHHLLGYPAVLNPLVQHVSGSRLSMQASHRAQTLVTKHHQFPMIMSGYEYEDSRFTFNSTRRDEDIIVKEVIPRYSGLYDVSNDHSPWITVIYEGCTSKEIGYFNIEKHHLGTDGFGWEYKRLADVRPGQYIPVDETIACSPNIDRELYGIGMNVPTVFMTTQEVIEDSMWISDQLADSFESNEYRKLLANIPRDVRPINRSNTDRVKVFPDIGEYVGDDGYLAAFRNVSTTTAAADIASSNMRKVNMLTDDVIVVPPGSQVINLEFITNKVRLNADYEQIEKYQQATLNYWRRIYDFYYKHAMKAPITPTMNVLVNTAITTLVGYGVKLPGYSDTITGRTDMEGVDRQPVEFIQAIVTYRRKRKVSTGFKISDDSGGKGIIAKISPVEDMPRDKWGNHAHLVMDPNSVSARLNPSQFWKCCLNFISRFVRIQVLEEAETDVERAFDTLVEWFHDVRPNYAQMTREVYHNKRLKEELIAWIRKYYIVLHLPPYYNGLDLKKVLELAKKWGAELSEITWVQRDENGRPEEVTTEAKTLIGEKYVVCLEKIPHHHAPGFAHVSHQGYPIKPPFHAQLRSTTVLSPIKLGEDEIRFISADAGSDTVARFIDILGNSPFTGTEPLIRELMTRYMPSALDRLDVSDADLAKGNTILGTFHHATSILGIDTRNTGVSAIDMEYNASVEGDDALYEPPPSDDDYGGIADLED